MIAQGLVIARPPEQFGVAPMRHHMVDQGRRFAALHAGRIREKPCAPEVAPAPGAVEPSAPRPVVSPPALEGPGATAPARVRGGTSGAEPGSAVGHWVASGFGGGRAGAVEARPGGNLAPRPSYSRPIAPRMDREICQLAATRIFRIAAGTTTRPPTRREAWIRVMRAVARVNGSVSTESSVRSAIR